MAVNPGHDNISCRGMYATTKIYGIEGHSYQLVFFMEENIISLIFKEWNLHCLLLI